MYVITNRKLHKGKKGLDIFGNDPNEDGPNELRLVEVTKLASGFKTRLLMDKLSKTRVKELIKKYRLPIESDEDRYASLEAACLLFEEARKKKKHLLFFVHGYNNDLGDIMKAAHRLELTYNVIAVPFSWPANGGGKVSGSVAYLSDKDDARVSMGALNRFIAKVGEYHGYLTEAQNNELLEKAEERFPNNPMAQQAHFTKLLERTCKVSLNLLCHSMGNYVFKYALKPGQSAAARLVFDNVSLVAADANSEGHREWIERVHVRNRLYVVINEKDYALGWSRRKPGEQQKARLGHYLRDLDASNAHYIDVTEAPQVGKDHGYFLGDPVNKNDKLRKMFSSIFEGGNAERALRYHPDNNTYSFKRP